MKSAHVYLEPHDRHEFDGEALAKKAEAVRRQKASIWTALKPNEAMFHLTLASAQEDGFALAVTLKPSGKAAATAPNEALARATRTVIAFLTPLTTTATVACPARS